MTERARKETAQQKSDPRDGVLHIIPADRRFIPPKEQQQQAVRRLEELVRGTPVCSAWDHEYVQVIGLFRVHRQKLVCPACGDEHTLSYDDVFYFSEALGVQPPTEIDLTMPCCDARVVLADVELGPNVGFARFGLEIAPRTTKLSAERIVALEKVLGCPLRQILSQ